MKMKEFPVIDPAATGENIRRLRQMRGLSVRDLQSFFGFEEPQAIYKWQRGDSLPTVDNLYALGSLLEVPLEQIIIPIRRPLKITEQQERTCCSERFWRRLPPFFPLPGSGILQPGGLWESIDHSLPARAGRLLTLDRDVFCFFASAAVAFFADLRSCALRFATRSACRDHLTFCFRQSYACTFRYAAQLYSSSAPEPAFASSVSCRGLKPRRR